jgi:choline kinase
VNTVVDTVAQLRNPLAAISNGSTSAEDKAKKESEKEEHVDRLLKEARWWRAANSAMWTIWGISQAKLPELERLVEGDDGEVEKVLHAGDGANGASSAEGVSGGDDGMRRDDVVIGNGEKMEGEPEEEEDFDYLAYSQDRARFFWGDMVGLGFLKREDLPEELRGRIKIVEN